MNAKKRMQILEGQTANQAWNLLLTLNPTIDKGKENESFNGLLEDYEKIYRRLLQQNVKMIIGKEGPKIPETDQPLDESTSKEKKIVEIRAAWKDKKYPNKKLK